MQDAKQAIRDKAGADQTDLKWGGGDSEKSVNGPAQSNLNHEASRGEASSVILDLQHPVLLAKIAGISAGSAPH